MKIAMIVAVLIGGASVLTGCGRDEPRQQIMADNAKAEYWTFKNSSAALWIDPETKCEYIAGTVSTAMTPRLDRNGKHICR